MIQWHIVTSSEYKLGSKVAEDMYFLSDTKQIYRGEVPFTESVIMYNNVLPVESIAVNRLYINSVNLEGKIYNGTDWSTVIKPLDETVTTEGANPVSGKAVASYVAAEIAKVAASKNTVSALSWDSAEHMLNITMADKQTTSQVLFDGLGVSLSYVSETGVLQMLDAQGSKIGTPINLPKEQFVTSGEYDAARKVIILYFDTEKTNKVEIDATGLVDIYTGVDAQSAKVEVSPDNKITATVKISTEQGNAIVLKADGIFVAPTDLSNYMTLVPDATDGHVATLDASGQVVDSGKTLAELTSNAKVYQGDSITNALNGATPNKGDFCIVKKVINGDKFELTAHYYDGAQWVAFDGNYNAENVFFDKDLVTTTAIGNIKLVNGQATIPAAGKNLKQVFDTIFVKEANPSTTQPAVSLNTPQNKAYEVGESVTPTFTASLSAGSYSYGPATAVTASEWSVTDTAGHTVKAATGQFDPVVVADDTRYTITATATHNEGAVPVTNVGNPYPTGKIQAGTKSKTSAAITGFRRGFYGTKADKASAIDSALVRSLASKTSTTPKKGETWNVSIPVGAMRIVIAYPATLGAIKSILDVNGMNAEIKSSFVLNTVDVEGANGATAISYNVYVMDRAAATEATNTYKVTL